MDICGRNGITLNPNIFCQEEVEFGGFIVTMDSVRPCTKYLRTIHDFPTPAILRTFDIDSALLTR